MKNLPSRPVFIVAVLFFMLQAAGHAQPAPKNLLVNGSFESPSNPPAPGAFVTLSGGGEAAVGFTGWRIACPGSIDVVDFTAPLLGVDWGSQAAVNGSQILDLNGNTIGSLDQVFPTVAGRLYKLSFSYTNNPIGGGNESALVQLVNIGATRTVLLSKTIKHTTATLTQPNWKSLAVTFKATGPITQVIFTSTSGASDGGGGIMLDSVKVLAQ
ncbi:MAG: DUF642 domain-containing protein [Thermosynechococcaceae cyanobacterium]